MTVPATIIRSAWRGEARKIIPKRSKSYLEAPVAIISMAQQARPNRRYHSDDLRAQLTTRSSLVVSTPGASSPRVSRTITQFPLLPQRPTAINCASSSRRSGISTVTKLRSTHCSAWRIAWSLPESPSKFGPIFSWIGSG